MNLARALARLAIAARRPLRRPSWLRLVRFEAAPTPKPIGPASTWAPPSPDDHFDEKWEEYPALKASSAAWMKRKVMDRATFDGLADALKARSFTAARVSSQKGLYDTLVSLQHGISEGLTVGEWREKYWDAIQKKFGKPGGTAAWYTTTVFRTNQQAAFAVGRYAEMFSDESVAMQPYVRYSAILDARVRPEHAALDGKVFSKLDPMARRYFPPLGYNCRCHLEAVPFGEEPRKITNGASIADLVGPDGKKIGPPPKGWDTDRVDSLLESFKLTKLGKPPAVVVPPGEPAPPPPPPKPLYGQPGWEAPNGLTQEAVENAYLWNPKVQKVTLLPDGTVRLKYHSSAAKIDVAPDKAQASVKLALTKKAAGPPPPKPAPTVPTPAPAPTPAAPPPVSPGAHIPVTPGNLKAVYGKGGLYDTHGWDEGAVAVHLNPDGSVLKTYADGSKKLVSAADVLADLDSFAGTPAYKKFLPDLPGGTATPAIPATPLGHPVTPETVQKVWGKGGAIANQGFTVDYDAELLPDGSVKLTKKPGAPAFTGLQKHVSNGGMTKTYPPDVAASVIDKKLPSPAPAKPARKPASPPPPPPPATTPAAPPPPTVKAPPKLVAKNGLTQDDVDALLAPDGIFAKLYPTTTYSGGTLHPDGSVTFKTSATGGGTTKIAPSAVKDWAKKHIPGWKPTAITKSGFTQADVDALVADSKGVWTSGKLKPSGGIDVIHANGKTIPMTADYADGLLKKTFPAGPGSASSGPGAGLPAKPAKDPLYGLKTIDAHLATPEDYDPTWTNPKGGKRAFGAVVFDEKGRILVREPAGHYDGYHWTFPKGKPSGAESALTAALREVQEETGVTFEAVGTVKGSHAGGSGTNHYFLARAKSSTGVLDSETSRIRWVGWDEAEALIKETTNGTGQKRDLDVLHAAVSEYEKLTGKKPPTFPKIPKAKPAEATAEMKPPAAAVVTKPVPGGPAELPTFSGFPDATEGLKEVRKLGGSTGAVLVEDAQGRRFVMKRGASPDHLREEVHADAAYHAAGVNVPEFRLYETKTGPVKLSKFIEGESLQSVVSKGGARAKDVLDRLRKDFAVDGLMGNWDVVGTGMDNVLVDAKGVPWRIDNGGSLRYRAQGGKKNTVEWNDWPTELWTLRGIEHPETDATRLFKDAGWKSITARSGELGARREAILRAVPEEVRRTLAARIEAMERLHATSVDMLADGWTEGYADVVSRHRIGMGQAGVLEKLPRKMTGDNRTLRDDAGRSFGGLRDTKGATGAFYDYLRKVASAGSDAEWGAKAVSKYMSSQAKSSQAGTPHRLKGWLMEKRPRPKGAYNGVETNDQNLLTKWRDHRKTLTAAQAKAWDEAFSAQHAFTIEMLGRVAVRDNDLARRTFTLSRSEGKSYHGSRPVGYKGTIPINPLESTSIFGQEFRPYDANFRWDVPHHRIFVTYWQSRYGEMGHSGLLGDGEAEFLALLEGLAGHRYK